MISPIFEPNLDKNLNVVLTFKDILFEQHPTHSVYNEYGIRQKYYQQVDLQFVQLIELP